MNKLTFLKGVNDGLPIALGYLSVSFAFGMLAISKGFPLWGPILISATNFTGTGQFAGLDLIIASAGYFEIGCTLLIINLRYALMSLSLSQKLSQEVTLWQRLLIAFGNTDEVFAVSIKQNKLLNFRYMMGIILCAFAGWISGTILGSAASSVLPETILSALGIALYAMFIAIIIPPARESSGVAKVIIISVLISCLLRYVPVINQLSSGWVIIICGVASSVLGALLFPMEKGVNADE